MSAPSTPNAPSAIMRLATIGGVVAGSLLLAMVRFCGDVPMPDKPPPPSEYVPAATALVRASATPDSWRKEIDRDAATAGVLPPTPEEMGRKLAYRSDPERRVMAPEEGSVETLGLRLTAVVAKDDGPTGKALVLTVENLSGRDLAYHVVSEPRPTGTACNQRTILPHDAMVLRAGQTAARSECIYRPGMTLLISQVETIELLPLQAFYVSRLPPAALDVNPRQARGHEPDLPGGTAICSTKASQALRVAIERGETTWRDLIDYYARHSCATYAFPDGYRAFEKDDARPLPVVEP